MSDESKPAGKRSLKVLDKSLMPEVLPDPAQARAHIGAGSPRDRVRRRLQQLSEQAAAIAAAVSLAACSNTSGGGPNTQHNAAGTSGGGASGVSGGGGGGVSGGGGTAGFGVVDPLPPPAGRGGFGGVGGVSGTGVSGSGGTAGFGVVDPIPEPFVCPTSPSDLIDLTSLEWRGDALILTAQSHDPRGSLAERLTQTQLPAGITATIENATNPFTVRFEADGGLFPIGFDAFLGFQCDGSQGIAHYQIGVTITPGIPGITEPTFELFSDDADAGI